MEKGQYHLLFPLRFVRCGVTYCGAVAPRVTAALLGRFLPRLGPLAHASGPFFLLTTAGGCDVIPPRRDKVAVPGSGCRPDDRRPVRDPLRAARTKRSARSVAR